MNLHSTTDASIWADEWLKTIKKHPDIPTDKETMIGWFANAIMAGYDVGRAAGEAIRRDNEAIHGNSDNNSLKATSLPDRESSQGVDGREAP